MRIWKIYFVKNSFFFFICISKIVGSIPQMLRFDNDLLIHSFKFYAV